MKITNVEFKNILTAAIAGDHAALEKILIMYMPMIDHQCTSEGELDEDMRQYILMRIALNISKFQI